MGLDDAVRVPKGVGLTFFFPGCGEGSQFGHVLDFSAISVQAIPSTIAASLSGLLRGAVKRSWFFFSRPPTLTRPFQTGGVLEGLNTRLIGPHRSLILVQTVLRHPDTSDPRREDGCQTTETETQDNE